MQFFKFAALAFAAVVSADDNIIAFGTAYAQENYQGGHELLFAGCHELKAPVLNNLHSISVSNNIECQAFSDVNCHGPSKAYYQKVAKITGKDSQVKSINCHPRRS